MCGPEAEEKEACRGLKTCREVAGDEAEEVEEEGGRRTEIGDEEETYGQQGFRVSSILSQQTMIWTQWTGTWNGIYIELVHNTY